MDSTDVLVIGGGIAGACAALAASAEGARAVLVRPGPGVTALSAGAWTDAPPAPVRHALGSAGLELIDCTAPLPHPDGRLLSCAAAPASHACAAIVHDAGTTRTLVCGIDGLPAFRPVALARLWSDAARLPTGTLQPVMLHLDDTPPAGWSHVSLAALLEHEPDRLTVPLAAALREHNATRAILPPVLGLDEHARVHATLQRRTGAMVGEALATAPSLPGWRLDRALLRMLQAADVQVVGGRVTTPTLDGDVIVSVLVAADTNPVVLAARAYVLATGKFAGGGIAAEHIFAEAALGCRVVAHRFGRAFDDASASLALTDPVRIEPQPVLSLGVLTDDGARPTRTSGDGALRNVVVAGSVRAGTETASVGLGSAAADGWSAGTRAAQLAQDPGMEVHTS